MVSGIPTNTNSITYGALKDRVPQNVNAVLPTSVQNLSSQDVQQGVQSTPTGSAASSMFELSTRGKVMTGGFWAGFIGLCSLLNKNFRKEDYNQTILGKIGSFGDKVSGGLDKIGVNKAAGTFSKGKNWILEKLPFLTTPTKNTLGMAKMQANGMMGYQTSDIIDMITRGLENNTDEVAKGFGLSGDDAIKAFKDNLVKFRDNPNEHLKEIDDLVTKLKSDKLKNVKFSTGDGKNILTKLTSRVFKREVTGMEMANKTIGAMGDKFVNNTGAKTTLGKKLTSGFTKVIEGGTNGYAGGKVMIVIQALVFAQAIDKAMKAPKGEKWSTFANEISNDFGAFLLLPLQMKLSNTANSIKYMGMGKGIAAQKAAVKAYRDKIAHINKQLVDAAGDATKYSRTTYLKEVKEAKQLLKGNSKWYHKPFKAIGRVLSMGLDNIKPYTADLGTGGKAVANAGNWLKRFAGGAGRFAVVLFVISPFIGKIVSKVSSAIFGKTTEMKKEEAEAKAAKEAKKQAKMNKNTASAELTEAETNELKARMMGSPEFLQAIEGNEQALNAIAQNPRALLETLREYDAQKAAATGQNTANEIMQNQALLNSLGIQTAQGQTQNQNVAIPQGQAQNMPPSILNQQGQSGAQNIGEQNLNMPTNQIPEGANVNNINTTTPANNTAPANIDNYTYIPSSEGYKNPNTLTAEQSAKVAQAMQMADEVEAQAMKCL
ncbi:hypothetical protein IKA15_00825 [bacterium]|nr:hypothetical protein [bacterium]